MNRNTRRTRHALVASIRAFNRAADAVTAAVSASYDAAAAATAAEAAAAFEVEDSRLEAAERYLDGSDRRLAEYLAARDTELARLVRDQREDARVAFVTRRPLPDDGERGARFDGIDDGDSEYGALEAHPFFM